MHAPAHHHDEAPVDRGVKFLTLAAVVVPPLALLAAMWFAWGGYFSATDLVLLAAGYVLTAMGITVGYHRLYTHRSFEASAPVAWTFTVLGSMAVQGPLIWWVTTHRRHHQHSDHDGDPHSPHAGRGPGLKGWLQGFGHAHVGWLFSRDHHASVARYSPDLDSDPHARTLSRLFPVWVALGLVIPAVIGGLVAQSWTGALLGFVWGGLVRILLVHHATWSVNSVCHLWGARTYRSGDQSRNNPAMGIIALGEGWHNNHHAFPASARHGLEWWQFDISWIAIRSLAAVGLVRSIRLPSPERMASKRMARAA